MELTNKALLELTQLTPKETSQTETASTRIHDQSFTMLVSNMFKQMGETDEQFKQAINAISSLPVIPRHCYNFKATLGSTVTMFH
ncbi:MAG: hypothetical protein ACMZI0_17795 [Symbiopectobacterium sp.]|uniref:hypothetical protein n=1 Tax=Symbiopectobacterium sp. TaxID=2952789 RepID=UPI0039ED2E71